MFSVTVRRLTRSHVTGVIEVVTLPKIALRREMMIASVTSVAEVGISQESARMLKMRTKLNASGVGTLTTLLGIARQAAALNNVATIARIWDTLQQTAQKLKHFEENVEIQENTWTILKIGHSGVKV